MEEELTEERMKCHSPLSIQTSQLAVLTDIQLDSLHLSANNFEDPFSVDINELEDGHSAEQIFAASDSKGYTFDDLIVLPGYIDFGVDEVVLDTRVTKRIKLSVPFVSSPMDTVTEEAMAIAMALHGGFGFIHCKSSIEVQAARVKAVKLFQNGFIARPACMRSNQLISDLDLLGVGGVPITEDGKIGSKLIGIVEKKDCDFIEDRSLPLSSVITPVSQMTTCKHPCTLAEANKTLMDAKANYLCVIDEKGRLKALTTRRDLIKNRDYPTATSTDNGNLLMVGAAVSLENHASARSSRQPTSPTRNSTTSSDGEGGSRFENYRPRSASFGATPRTFASALSGGGGGVGAASRNSASSNNTDGEDQEEEKKEKEYQVRSRALVEAGVNVIVVDCLHGDTFEQVKAIKWLKSTFGDSLEVVGGNVATASQAKRLLEAGVDGLRVGMGTGSVATAQEVKACGRAQLSAVFNCVKLARK
jgi:IMP dehydrogenase/GMP reductase